MSGTRKMEKFELDAVTKAHGKERSRDAEDDDANAPPSSRAVQAAKDAAAAIADIDEMSALDALTPTPGGIVDLPARPFAPAQPDMADLPARAFAPVSGTGADMNLPSLPFTPRQPDTADVARPEALPSRATSDSMMTAAEPAFAPGEWVPPQSEQGSPQPATKDEVEQLRTQLARKFVSLADSVTEAFGDFSIGAGAWGIELTAPQGMSTGGGKQALQHIRLRPRRQGYSVLVAGTVNQVDRRADLRDYDHVTITHEVRFRNPLEINQQEWEQFLRKAEVVLNAAGIQSMRTPPPRELLDQRRSMQRVSKGAVFALVIILILAAIVLWRVFVALNAG